MRQLKKTTRIFRVLDFISKNEPVKTKDILKSLFTVRKLHKLDWSRPQNDPITTDKLYNTYPGWSGTRAHLTTNNGYNSYPASIELTKDGYILTEFGRQRLLQAK